jgi:hypothetical protein
LTVGGRRVIMAGAPTHKGSHEKTRCTGTLPGEVQRVEVTVRDHLTRPAAACPEPFDAIPRSVQCRDDLTYGAKCLYGALSTAQRTRWQPTYADLADHLSASTRSVVRWVQQLVSAGLIAVRRRGQGLSNLFSVLALVTSGQDRPARQRVTGWQRRAPSPFNKETGTKNGYIDPRRNYGYVQPARRSSDLLMSRHGPVVPRR